MQNHLPPISLDYGENSVIYCSYKQPQNLIVFIHGFNGSSLGTWDDFPLLILNHNKFSESDIIFYGYDSLKTQLTNMSLRFFKLLDAFSDPSTLFPSRKLPAGMTYDKIFVVAHSLGAVVTRFSLLRANKIKTPWLTKCNMILYAPAHHGSRIPENFGECFTGVGTVLKGLALSAFPIIKDLTEGSVVLTQLREKTESLLSSGKGDFTKAKVVRWASNDVVIISASFGDDVDEDEILKTSHTSVCKPKNPTFLEPFNCLVNAL